MRSLRSDLKLDFLASQKTDFTFIYTQMATALETRSQRFVCTVEGYGKAPFR